jgi:hypothetical protein
MSGQNEPNIYAAGRRRSAASSVPATRQTADGPVSSIGTLELFDLVIKGVIAHLKA